MTRRKKQSFKLDPDWMLSQPIDFEYNKYTILNYIQKCEQNFDKFEIYPDFVELALHLANVQSLIKERRLLQTKKKFESCDDEILLKELHPQQLPTMEDGEYNELEKTLVFSGNRLMDTFNIGKSIWSIVYESTTLNEKKNGDNMGFGHGFVYYPIRSKKQVYLWEYSIRKMKKSKSDAKIYFDLIWSGDPQGQRINTLIKESTSWKELVDFTKLPVFEVESNENFPFEQTLIPMIKRKLLAYILQSVPKEKWESFDSLKTIS